jgi:dihydroorotase
LLIARQAAERLGMSMMVHIDEPPPTLDEVLALMRPGDVLTHCFRPFPNTPATADGRVEPFVREAREGELSSSLGLALVKKSINKSIHNKR